MNPLNNILYESLARLGDASADSHCYGPLGDFDGRCDRNFGELLPTAIAEIPSREGKNAGLLALLYFSVAVTNLGPGETLFEGGLTQVAEGSCAPPRTFVYPSGE